MDYVGQKQAERIFQLIIIIFCVFGWILGSLNQHYDYALYSWALGAAIALLVCIPSWPCFNRNPLRFVPVKSATAQQIPEAVGIVQQQQQQQQQ